MLDKFSFAQKNFLKQKILNAQQYIKLLYTCIIDSINSNACIKDPIFIF